MYKMIILTAKFPLYLVKNRGLWIVCVKQLQKQYVLDAPVNRSMAEVHVCRHCVSVTVFGISVGCIN